MLNNSVNNSTTNDINFCWIFFVCERTLLRFCLILTTTLKIVYFNLNKDKKGQLFPRATKLIMRISNIFFSWYYSFYFTVNEPCDMYVGVILDTLLSFSICICKSSILVQVTVFPSCLTKTLWPPWNDYCHQFLPGHS